MSGDTVLWVCIDALGRRGYAHRVRARSKRWWPVALAEGLGSLCLLLWVGGLVGLGAFAAPGVFGALERERAGAVMVPIFSRFDRFAAVLVALFAAAEVARIVGRGLGSWPARLRAAASAVLVAAGLLSSLWFGPRIGALFQAGARRGSGEAGRALDRAHVAAETAGKAAAGAAAVWLVLAAFERRRAESEHQR